MIAAAALLLAAAPQPFSRVEDTPILHFRYAWPAEAETIQALRTLWRRQMAMAQQEAVEAAQESHEAARDAEVTFHQELYDKVWSLEASSAHLLSFTADLRTDNNGAHPNRDFDSLIWDRSANRAVSAASLLGRGLAGMSARYCRLLTAQVNARGGEAPERCPALAERVLSFSDSDHDGRFDALHVLVPPYVAASYADGSFVVDVPLEGGDLAAVPAAYRSDFESR